MHCLGWSCIPMPKEIFHTSSPPRVFQSWADQIVHLVWQHRTLVPNIQILRRPPWNSAWPAPPPKKKTSQSVDAHPNLWDLCLAESNYVCVESVLLFEKMSCWMENHFLQRAKVKWFKIQNISMNSRHLKSAEIFSRKTAEKVTWNFAENHGAQKCSMGSRKPRKPNDTFY